MRLEPEGRGADVADLFLDDLSTIATADVEAFLALNSPEDQRPTETSRLDFKDSFIPDIGDAVAALANTHGGLIVIGVKGEKAKQNIPVEMPGASNLGSDAKARITDAILATVQPRPMIEIGLVNGRKPGGIVAVVRVEEGTYPPYQFQRGATIRIPIRVQDTNRQATVRELETLLRKRDLLGRPAADIVTPYSRGGDLFCTFDAPNGVLQETDFHKILVAPRVPLRLRQDTKFERAFEKLVLSCFRQDHNLTGKFGRGTYFQTERRVSGRGRTHRVWRSWSDGALGFVGNLTRPCPRGQPVGDIVADLVFFCRLAMGLFDFRNYQGAVVLLDELACGSTKLVAEFPPPDGVGDYDEVPGIHLPNERPQVLPARTVCIEEVDRATLENPEEMVGEVVLAQLRETHGASVNFDKLLEVIHRLADQSKTPGWGSQ